MKIVTHKAPRHLDDTLAVALLLNKYQDAEVEFIHPQDEKLESYKKDKNIILVDVGGDYNPLLKNYDHHHNSEIPCSLMLVLKHEFEDLYNTIISDAFLKREFEFIDVKDRFGFKEAVKRFDITPLYTLENLGLKMGNSKESLKMLGENLLNMLEEVKKEKEILEKVEIKNINGLKVAIDKVGAKPSLVFNKGVDLLIQVNSMDKNNTSVIKNTQSDKSKFINLENLKDHYDVKFIHPTGFICVLSEPIDKVNYKKIVNIVFKKPRDLENKMILEP